MVIEEEGVSLLVYLDANSVDEGGVKGMTVVQFQISVLQKTRVESSAGAQLYVKFVGLSSSPAFEGTSNVVDRCADGHRRLCGGRSRSPIRLIRWQGSRDLGGLCK